MIIHYNNIVVCHSLFIFISATCINPQYVLHINESIRTVDIKERGLDATHNMCCSGLLITKADTTTCLGNGDWELETIQLKSEG